MAGYGDVRMRGDAVELSDDDEGDRPPPRPSVSSSRSRVDVQDVLRCRGVRMRPEWLESCLTGLAVVRPGFRALPVERQAELCFGQALMADFNVAGAGCLPPDCQGLHKRELEGPFVLQVDEVVDVGSPLRERYKEKQGGRCLKLSMTDGVQRVFGVEYRFIAALQVLLPAGVKIVVRHVQIRRGLLLLVPEVVNVVGGFVERLEAARQRVVLEVNKPPRGHRGNLAELAASSAWPAEEEESGDVAHGPRTGAAAPLPEMGRGRGSSEAVPREGAADVVRMSRSEPVLSRSEPVSFSGDVVETLESRNLPEASAGAPRPRGGSRLSLRKESGRSEGASASSSEGRGQVPFVFPPPSAEMLAPMEVDEEAREIRTGNSTCANVAGSLPSRAETETDAEEGPFSYLATLRNRMLSEKKPVSGRVKCVLVGVKEFRLTEQGFKLIVHVDDGSLITAAVVKEDLILEFMQQSQQRIFGIDTAGSSLLSLMTMENKRELQTFLQRFEGFVEVEFQGPGEPPLLTSMQEEVPSAYAWTLFHRVSKSVLKKNTRHNEVIELSSP